ncbi:MAG TPA: hypothetical protein VIN59_09510 [Alphaproteobacteria bacterium]
MTLYNFSDDYIKNIGDDFTFNYVPRGTRPNRQYARFVDLTCKDLTGLISGADELEFKIVYCDPFPHANPEEGIHALRGTFKRLAGPDIVYETHDDHSTFRIHVGPESRYLKIQEFSDHPLSAHFKGHYKLRDIFTPFGFNRKDNRADTKKLLADYRPYLHRLIALDLEGKPSPIFRGLKV